jgi:hypothetical protein
MACNGTALLYFTTFILALGSTRSLIQWLTVAIYLGGKRPGHRAEYSLNIETRLECLLLFFHSHTRFRYIHTYSYEKKYVRLISIKLHKF